MISSRSTSIISVDRVTKSFPHHGRALLRQQLQSWLKRERSENRFFAVKDISFEVGRGESVAIIGTNGSGKSTLLSLLCGLTPPDSGSIEVRGKVAALLDLGSGFHLDLTGVENLRLNASLIGLSRQRTEELFNAIVEFSELGDFIYEPLRTFSTGMIMRLAFSVAVHLDPDTLIIDEVLAVGDQSFQQKCFDRILDFRKAGHTLLIVSHAAGILRDVCSRAIWLDHGNLIADGEVNSVLDLYEQRLVPT